MSTKSLTKRPGRRPMLQPLDHYLGLELEVLTNTELEAFAEEHKRFVRLSDDKTEARFSIECHTFVIRADYDSRVDKTVYQGLVEGHAPYEVMFDTGYRNSVDEVLSHLQIGIRNLGLGSTPDDEDEDEDEDDYE